MSWHHDFDDEPVLLHSEIDDEGVERRKVDEYSDGRLDFADETREMGTTRLSETAVPAAEEIDAQDEFSVEIIDGAVFDEIWRRATGEAG